tara:strand:- start:2093 stop:2299 length:207 start_codon:yes stop_codon:yes gene_type:complete
MVWRLKPSFNRAGPPYTPTGSGLVSVASIAMARGAMTDDFFLPKVIEVTQGTLEALGTTARRAVIWRV